MQRRSFIVTSAAGITLAASVRAFSQATSKTAVKTGYAPVNGLNLYYEIHGTGEPLILLHGGLGAGEMFAEILPLLSNSRRAITVDLQAHGRTADINRLQLTGSIPAHCNRLLPIAWRRLIDVDL